LTNRRSILVIVPALDEQESIGQVLRSLARSRSDCDVLVIDDGSSDRTAEVARAHGAAVLSHGANRGYGAALVSGYRHALANGYETVVQLDADGQHDPAQIERLLKALKTEEAEMAIGSRMMDGGGHVASFPRVAGIHFFAWLGRALGVRVTDPTSGFAAMSRRAAAFLAENTPDDFPDLNVRIALHRAAIRVVEVPVTMGPRLAGESQLRGLKPLVYLARMAVYLVRACRSSPSMPLE
jgi:glycosyltransferase involved in cell wall biosynthesis